MAGSYANTWFPTQKLNIISRRRIYWRRARAARPLSGKSICKFLKKYICTYNWQKFLFIYNDLICCRTLWTGRLTWKENVSKGIWLLSKLVSVYGSQRINIIIISWRCCSVHWNKDGIGSQKLRSRWEFTKWREAAGQSYEKYHSTVPLRRIKTETKLATNFRFSLNFKLTEELTD